MENAAAKRSDPALALLSSQAALLGFATSTLYTAANSLFLARHGTVALPLAYLATAACVPPIFALLLRMQKSMPLPVFCMAPLLSLAALLATARILLGDASSAWLTFALMVFVVLAMQAGMIALGSRANQLWDLQEMKRRYPLVMAGQVAGVIAGGGLAGPLSRVLGGTPNLLYLAAASLAAGALLGLAVSRERRPASIRAASGPRGSRASPLGSRYVRRLFAFRFSVELGSNLVNFLFLREVEGRLRGTEAVTAFLGLFMALATLLTLAFLALASGRILMRLGVGAGLAGNPLAVGAMLAAAVAAAAIAGVDAPSFYALALAARLVNFVVVTGLTDPALKAAYQPLDPRRRVAAQTMVEGLGVPMAVGLAGAILLGLAALPGLGSGQVALISLLAMAVVLLLARAAYRSYLGELERALAGPRAELERVSIEDATSLATVASLLDSCDGKRVRLALDILEGAGSPGFSERLPALLEHGDPSVRAEAALRIERARLRQALPALRRLLEREAEPSVKAAAIRAFCALDPAGEELAQGFANDADPTLRLGALAGLLRSRGINGALAACGELGRLLRSPKAGDRLFLARLVGEAADPGFSAPLDALLEDPDPAVRREALRAAPKAAAPRVLGKVVACMEDPAFRSEAAAALAAFGARLVPAAAAALDPASPVPKEARLRLIRACGRISAPESAALLSSRLGHPDPETRSELARALGVLGYASPPGERDGLRALALAELGRAEELRARGEAFRASLSPSLASALRDEFEAACRLLFALLGFLDGKPGLERAFDRLRSGGAKDRGLARELLEASLDRQFRRRALALVDAGSGPSPRGGGDPLADILARPEAWPYPWVIACAAYEAARSGRRDLIAEVGALADDDDAIIARAARWSVRALEGVEHGDEDMMDVERVLLLKSSPIFEETPDRALASLASLAERVDSASGETVIRKGDLESCLYVVARGRMRVHDGDRTIALLEAGEIIGEMALLDPAPRSASVTAAEDSTLLRLDKEAFDLIMADNPEIAQGVLRVLCRRLRVQLQRTA